MPAQSQHGSFTEVRRSVVKFATKPKVFVRGLAVGVVLAVTLISRLVFPARTSATVETLSPSTVFERIVAQNEMVSVSQNYSIVDKASDTNRLFDLIDIPFTDNSFWYRYCGTIKAGVNLGTAEIKEQGGTITITLDQPYIIANEPDMDKSGVLEEHNNVLNPIHVEDVDAFVAQCKAEAEQEAIEDHGLLDEAKTSAEENLKNLFYGAFGDTYTVDIQYRE